MMLLSDLSYWLSLLSKLTYWLSPLPMAMVLAVAATMGYLFGRRTTPPATRLMHQSRKELQRAQFVANELQRIAASVSKHLESHQANITRFKERVNQLNGLTDEEGVAKLWKEAEAIISPTQQLANEIGAAYVGLRQQAVQLLTLTEIRTDPLTGARNRRALDETLDTLMSMYCRYEQPFAVAILDIDNFKRVNDELGHLVGDRALQEVVSKLDDATRQTDLVFRYGGEEFVVTMPQTNLDQAAILAERLRKSIEKNPIGEFRLTISAGIACVSEEDDTASLLARADDALYDAKSAGRNQIRGHDNQSDSSTTANTEPATIKIESATTQIETAAK